MKTISSFFTILVLLTPTWAEESAKISDSHLCCKSCNKAAIAAIEEAGAKATIEDKVIHINAPDAATMQKAGDSLRAAGFGGKSDSEKLNLDPTDAKNDKVVEKITVKGVHLCCQGCIKAAKEAVSETKGTTGDTASKDADSFEVTGSFNINDLAKALSAQGLSGTFVE